MLALIDNGKATVQNLVLHPMMEVRSEARTIDPILNLPVHSSVKSICFVSRKNPDDFCKEYEGNNVDDIDSSSSQSSEDDDEEDDDDDDGEIRFRSNILLSQKGKDPVCNRNNNSRRRVSLNGRFLASCHSDGEALLWDLNNQKTMTTISSPRGGPGMTIRRTDDPSKILYQTRDPKGIVSLHSIDRCVGAASTSRSNTNATTTRQYETFSRTFCQAAPCYGNKNLLALPSIDDSTVIVVDERAGTNNVAKYNIKGHGMLTSLALCDSATTNNASGRPVLACGMESGTVTFFDISDGSSSQSSSEAASFSLGKEPILTLDLVPSGASAVTPNNAIPAPESNSIPSESISNSLLVAAGMAGDAEDISQLSNNEVGRAAIFKTVYCHNNDYTTPIWTFKQRARLSTCSVDNDNFHGKPGVSICRFRPQDGRLLAIGGWDYRIRLFERSKGNAMAILKGNGGSIADLDWSPDACTSGLLASASGNDKSIAIWQCFAKR